MPYTNSSGEKGISVFEYGDDGRLSRSEWRLLDNSRSSQNYYKYDVNGNIIEKYREFSDSITSTETFEYDSDNYLLSEKFVRSDGFVYSIGYENDTEGRVVKAYFKNYHGWFNGDISFSYNDAGLIIEGKIIENNKEIGFIDFKYDSGNRLLEEYWEFPGNYSQTFTFEYSIPELNYSSSNVFINNSGKYKIIREQYDYNGSMGGPSIYSYSEGNRLEKKIYIVNGKIKTETTYEYDEKGNLISSQRIFADGSVTDFRYKFNNKGQLTDRIYLKGDSIIGEEHFEYLHGRLYKGVYKNFDSWLTGSLTFENDSDGKLSKGMFKGNDGSEADIFYYYDAYFNLIKIHWNFSSGITQTYTFEYEEIV